MTTLTKKKLLDQLKDKETREVFAAEHVTTGIPFQIHALREKWGMTQAELARKAGMAQERISVLEDPNYEFIPKIGTLLKLADVFDVPLIVRFGSWGEIFEWETGLSPEALAPPTFDEEVESLEDFVVIGSTVIAEPTTTVDTANFMNLIGEELPADGRDELLLRMFLESKLVSEQIEGKPLDSEVDWELSIGSLPINTTQTIERVM